MKYEQAKRSLMLALTALIWGVAFVAQSVGMDYVGPFTFNSVRSFIGGLVLLPMIPLLDRMKKRPAAELKAELKSQKKMLVIGGLICGALLAVASSLQQIGLVDTTPGKAGFITALYIIIVPVLGLFMKKKPSVLVWAGVALAAVGMYLLCFSEGIDFRTLVVPGPDGEEIIHTGESFSVNRGDIMIMLCALMFSFHILVIDRFSPRVDGVRLSMIQFFVCGALCAVPMLLMEKPDLSSILSAWLPILYAGALSCGVAYTLQIIGQRNINPTVASLILSLESVFSALAGWLILGDTLTGRELMGCALVFIAILLAQLPAPGKRRPDHGQI